MQRLARLKKYLPALRFKERLQSLRNRERGPRLLRIARPSRRVLAVLLAGVVLLVAGIVVIPLFSPQTVIVAPNLPPEPAVRDKIVTGVVRSGETLSTLLAPWLTIQEIHGLAVTAVTAGHPWKATLRDGTLQRFEHDINDRDQLIVSRSATGRVSALRLAIPYTYAEREVGGTISASLFAAMDALGEEDGLAIVLADIFASDIDFIRDIRSGDAFRVIVERRLRDGQPDGYGKVIAAEFTNAGKTYRAFRFQDGSKKPAFYDAAGRSLRKALLRAPLPFSRVSSGFTMRRFHPIAKTWRAHPAIDYAAPTGTPIMAVGDATVIAAGRTAGNGNFVKLRHAGGLETMYLHMSRFAGGMRGGKRVRQGEVIGYVGSTGLATGPHLCYRMTRNGAPVNPAKIPTTPGEPISRASLDHFRTASAPLIARLAAISTTPALSRPRG